MGRMYFIYKYSLENIIGCNMACITFKRSMLITMFTYITSTLLYESNLEPSADGAIYGVTHDKDRFYFENQRKRDYFISHDAV